MRCLEKVMVTACLVLGLTLLACVATGAWAYTDPANITTATLSDARVNPSQSVTWTLGPVLNTTGQPVGGGNSSLSFTTEYVTINDDASLEFGANDYTIECRAYASPDDAWFHVMVSRRENPDPTHDIISLGRSPTGVLAYHIVNNGVNVQTCNSGTTTVPLNTWYHVIVSLTGSTLKMYVNGVDVTTSPVVTGDVPDFASALFVAKTEGYYGFGWEGLIDEVRAYNSRGLTSAEATQHYQGIYISETGLVLHLDFDGQTLDQSGNGNDGTHSGAPVYVDGWASVPVSTYFNATQSVASRRILVNSTTGAALSTVPDTAPATWGNYTAELAPDTSIGNVTIAPFLVDTYLVDVYTVHPEIDAGFNTLLYAIGTSRLGDHSLTDGDTLTVEGVVFAWNSYTDRFEATDSETTPQTRTYDTLTALSEATYGITSGAMNVTAAVTWVTPQLDLVQVYLSTGDLLGAVYIMATAQLGGLFLYTFIMVGVSLAVYNYTGPEATLLAWMLGWGTFSAVVHGEAVGVALILLALGGGLLIAKMFLDRRAA